MAEQDDVPAGGSVSPWIAEAKDWAKGRKPADLCMELYVRMAELTLALYRIMSMHAMDLDGQPVQAELQHPAPPPEVLQAWLEQLLPQKGGKRG